MIEQIPTPTAEEVARNYAAALDSVALLNADKPEHATDSDWADCIERNVAHLKIMIAKDYWTNEDLTPLQAAVDLHRKNA